MSENIIQSEYSDEMKKSYIDYAMSVITSRAVPDIRDGLKPVQRRILFDMNELHVTPDKPTLKSARITGDTMGKYHPHGDASIYDTMVVMAQDFKKMSPMILGQGNFGSIEGDPAAAPRYTEAKLTKYSNEVLLSDMEDTVDFLPNYDGNLKEPEVLPARLPNFLINGSEGIAVGMTTNTPPHNLGEVIDLVTEYLKNPKMTVPEMLQFLKGPDFPTGGIVANKNELESIYKTGSGKIRLRGKLIFEPGKKRNERDRLVVTEIPYTMIGSGISKFMQDIADLCEKKILTDVLDISNHSDKEGVRIVIELKKGADVERIKNILYKDTKLEDTFGVHMLAINKGRPETMTLKTILESYVEYQHILLTRKFTALAKREKERLHVLEGLIKAVDMIDAIIAVIRSSKTQAEAKRIMMTGDISKIKLPNKTIEKQVKLLSFSEIQAQAILDMRLARLVGLEIDALIKSKKDCEKKIKEYEKILSSKKSINNHLASELESFKKNYGIPRKTQIENSEAASYEKKKEILEVYYVQDKFNYGRLLDTTTYERNREAVDSDSKFVIKTTSDDSIAIFSDTGRLHIIRLSDVPLCKFKDKGIPIDNISKFVTHDETILYLDSLSHLPDTDLAFITANGYGKHVKGEEFIVSTKLSKATNLKENDSLIFVGPLSDVPKSLSSEKKKYKVQVNDIPDKKKNTIGNKIVTLKKDDVLKSSVI